jgi:hypothetical protein
MKILSGRAGSHTWDTVQPFNEKTTGLNKLVGNFTRLWTIETRGFVADGSKWGSNTSGLIQVQAVPWKKDGSLNHEYYKRLRGVVRRAEAMDILTGVVLFDHAFQGFFERGWENHALNGLGPSSAEFVHTKGAWNKYQRLHVKAVARTIEPYQAIAEVGNELHRNSVNWFQGKVIKWWRKFSDKPIGVSYASGMKASSGRSQGWIARTGADWAAPAGGERIPGFRGGYVFDTDHASPLRSNVAGLKAAWSRGDALWLMDGLTGRILKNIDDLDPDRSFLDSVL